MVPRLVPVPANLRPYGLPTVGMSVGTTLRPYGVPASERKRNNFKGSTDFYVKAKDRIWP